MSEETILTPTEELYKEIFGELPEQDLDEKDIPGLQEILDTVAIAPRDAEAIKMRIGLGCDKHTYKAIGEKFNVKAVRARQIVLKAFQKLRHQSKNWRIKLLFASRGELRGQIDELHVQIVEIRDREYRLSIEVARLNFERKAIQKHLRHCTTVLSSYTIETDDALPKTIPIEELNLPLLVRHSLRRDNIDTVADLIGRTRKDLMKIRKVGKKNIEEVERKLAERGLQLQEDDNELSHD